MMVIYEICLYYENNHTHTVTIEYAGVDKNLSKYLLLFHAKTAELNKLVDNLNKFRRKHK